MIRISTLPDLPANDIVPAVAVRPILNVMWKSRAIAKPVSLLALLAFLATISQRVAAQPMTEPFRCLYPEQRCISHRCPSGLCRAPIPHISRPPTVRNPQYDTRQEQLLSLDEAICIALQNAEVIRVLSGQFASSTGRTIYDPAITNTQIDEARARFDPVLDIRNNWDLVDVPGGVDSQAYRYSLDLTQTNPSGGTANLGVAANRQPSNRTPSALELSYRHPLLEGAGTAVNVAPIVIARLDTERSYFQLKNSIQDMVASVIEGYWGLVLSRTQVWATAQQVEQAEYAYNIFKAQLDAGRGDIGDTAQAEVSLASFRASLIAAQGDLLNREAAFRNVLGLPPVDAVHFVPSTAPKSDRIEPDWDSLLGIAEQNRPDIIEIKLNLETNYQRRLVANNQVLPSIDASALYRTQFGEVTEWQFGVDYSLPLFQRLERANLRRIDLLLARDRANLRQQIHQVSHELAQSIRSLDQRYAQYEAFRKVREASRVNLDRIFALFDIGGLPTERVIYLNVLLAITDWGNAVSSEAAALAQYNSELANLERQLGTILDNHAIRFHEEQFASIGPGGRHRQQPCYPQSLVPDCGPPQYDSGVRPAEEAFGLDAVDFGPNRRVHRDGTNLQPMNQGRVEDNADDEIIPLPPTTEAPLESPRLRPPTDEDLRERFERLRKEIESNRLIEPEP